MKGFKITILLLTLATGLLAQPTLGRIAYYSFDNCDGKDDTGNGYDATVFGNPSCECGVKGDALSLDGIDDYILFNSNGVNGNLRAGNFTISFYFKAKAAATPRQNILSRREACNDDTRFNIDYIESIDFMTVDAVQDGFGSVFMSSNAAATCWHHCVIVRDRQDFYLYLDGRLKVKSSTTNILDLTTNSPLMLGNSPCIGQTVSRFKGLVDEFYVYNSALRPEQLRGFNLAPDKIGNQDTILFTGDRIETFVRNTCATDFLWSPIFDIADPTSPNTIIAPNDTAMYVLRITDSDLCVTYDTLNINVINPEDLPCDKVFLPSAFTPNSDDRNDRYGISNPVIVKQLKIFEIYDRWGSRVFATDDPFETWDGTFKGTTVNPGVYIWRVEYSCENQEKTETGTVTILR